MEEEDKRSILQVHIIKTYKNLGDKYSKSRKFAAMIKRQQFFKIIPAFAAHVCIIVV